jgi:hypothetical protein
VLFENRSFGNLLGPLYAPGGDRQAASSLKHRSLSHARAASGYVVNMSPIDPTALVFGVSSISREMCTVSRESLYLECIHRGQAR